MVLSKVDFPAPDRPITPTKPPGETENEALSTAAFVPKRHVKPSTTSMQCSRVPRPSSLALGFNSRVTVALQCGIHPHPGCPVMDPSCQCHQSRRRQGTLIGYSRFLECLHERQDAFGRSLRRS